MGMKMARATRADMDAAGEIAGILDNVARGYYPSPIDAPDTDPTFFDANEPDHLRFLFGRLMEAMRSAPGGLFRVTGGFHTIMHNDVVDPDADVLELHPRIVAALAAADAPTRAPLPPFPTMLRKMWSGGEVQRWIDEHVAPLVNLSQAELDALAERRRQVSVERFTAEHDDGHNPGTLAVAAACYALRCAAELAAADSAYWSRKFAGAARDLWQWDTDWWKPGTPYRDMEKAVGLALAEMERINRGGGRG